MFHVTVSSVLSLASFLMYVVLRSILDESCIFLTLEIQPALEIFLHLRYSKIPVVTGMFWIDVALFK